MGYSTQTLGTSWKIRAEAGLPRTKSPWGAEYVSGQAAILQVQELRSSLARGIETALVVQQGAVVGYRGSDYLDLNAVV